MKNEKRKTKIYCSFKAKVAIEAIQEKLTLQEISSYYTIHQNQITTWKKEFLDKSEMIFSREKLDKSDESKEKDHYSKIGELQVQVDFLKKVLGK